MRQGQQNRRGRGRNRKAHHNPLTRSFESNGPDVKIRGTPSHIAEKYMSLARDAQSSGDPVLAENYLQHAEHYNRIIMAFREQNIQQAGESLNGMSRHRGEGVEGEEFAEDEGDDAEGFAPPIRGLEPQPRGDAPARFEDRGHRHYDDRQNRHNNDHSRPMRDRFQDPRSGVQGERQPSAVSPSQHQPVLAAAEEAVPEAMPQPRNEPAPRRRDRFSSASHEQPEFLRRPVRRPRREAQAGSESNGAAVETNGAGNKDSRGGDEGA